MIRRRLFIVALIASLWAVLVPLPAPAKPRFPATLDRSFELARGQRVTASRAAGASLERSSRRLPIQANLVAMSFRTTTRDDDAIEEGISITARFHTQSGWGAWEEMPVEPDEGPDTSAREAQRAANRIFTAPIWVGTADAMAYRVTAKPGAPAVFDLRAHVVNSLGDSQPLNLFQRVIAAISRFFHGTEAEAMTSTPSIITRRQWGANESWRECCPRYAPAVQMAFVHHTAGTNSYSRSQSAALVRSIYKFHTSNRGWSDIGYNFLVDRYGQIFEGRYGGMTKPVIGAHVKGFNTGSTGISLMGTFTSSTPTTAMQSALKRLLAWKLDVHHLPPTGKVTMTSGGNPKYAAGTRVTFNRISGHRDGQQTACPGAKAYYLLPSIRKAVAAMGLPKIYLPTISSTVLRPDGDTKNETVTVRATFSRSLSWSVEFLTVGGSGVLRKLTGYGSSLTATWNGRTAVGTLADYTGAVPVRIKASVRSLVARPASLLAYFVTKHPNGTILRTPTRTVVIEDGKARLVTSQLVLNSWYRAAEVVATTDQEVDRYPSGSPLELREGTLLTEPDGTHAIYSAGKVRQFDDGVYEALKYTAASALPISALELATLPTGPDISDGTVHPQGAVVRASDGSVWTIDNGFRRRNPTVTVWKSRYRDAEIVPMSIVDVAIPVGTPMTYREGTLLKGPTGTRWIYADGVKRPFYNDSLYVAMGYSTAAAFSITTAEANTIPNGPLIA